MPWAQKGCTVLTNRACYEMEWKENLGMEYRIVKVWNEIEDFINGMERIFHTSILAHFNVVFILSAVKAAFDQIHKMIEKKVVAEGRFK